MPLINLIKPVEDVAMNVLGHVLRQLELLLLVEEPGVEPVLVPGPALLLGDVHQFHPDGVLLPPVSVIDVKHHHWSRVFNIHRHLLILANVYLTSHYYRHICPDVGIGMAATVCDILEIRTIGKMIRVHLPINPLTLCSVCVPFSSHFDDAVKSLTEKDLEMHK